MAHGKKLISRPGCRANHYTLLNSSLLRVKFDLLQVMVVLKNKFIAQKE